MATVSLPLDLWIPPGATYQGVQAAGTNVETGGTVVTHKLKVTYTDVWKVKHSQIIQVLADDDVSQAQIDEMFGNATEKFYEECKQKYARRPATAEERKEAGKALNDILKHRTIRQESTTGKVYFKGIRR
jgi:hypothetical protein